MSVFGLSPSERILGYDSIDLLPDLEESVLFDDVLISNLEDSFELGMEDWWGDFVADIYL